MIIIMNESQIETMEQVRGFLQGAKTVVASDN